MPAILFRLLPYALAALIVGGFAWWISDMRSDLAKTEQLLATTRMDLEQEQASRKRDVAALTVLSQGIVSAASARAIDEKGLSNAIAANPPQPASPLLRDLLSCLRAAATNRDCSAPARTGAAAPASAARP